MAGVPPHGAVEVTVVDPDNAKVTHAQIRIFARRATDGALLRTVETDRLGDAVLALPPGNYLVQVAAAGFVTVEKEVQIRAEHNDVILVRLRIATKDEAVNVASEEQGGSVSDGQALVLRGSALDAFSSNPATLQEQINGLVSTDDGAPPELRVDGFSNSRLPPKSAIREIRVNQNAYSSQFDQRGNSVIDIFTRPGGNQLVGDLYLQGNANAMNASNPFLPDAPGYHSLFFDGTVSGPIGKHTSFYAGADVNDLQNRAAVRATVLNADLQQVPFAQSVNTPLVTGVLNLRIDHQFTSGHSLTVRGDWATARQTNAGLALGQLVLPSEGYHSISNTLTLQVGETAVLSPRLVLETRFQYRRTWLDQTPNSTAPSVIVQGAFSGGGTPSQAQRDVLNNYEFQEYASLEHHNHFFRAGFRYRETRDSNASSANFNGQYTFSSIAAYQITMQGMAAGLTPGQIQAAGGGASQYSITTGTPGAVVSTGDLGAYFEDEWKVKPNFSLVPGFRFESQYGIPDHADPAPRLAFAWTILHGVSRTPLVRLRGGVGLFYDRFSATNLLTTVRYNGVLQRPYFTEDPSTVVSAPFAPMMGAASSTTYQLAPGLRSPYVIGEGVTADRSFGRFGSLSVAFTHERGVHLLLSRNANAPLNGIRPSGGTQNAYQFASLGTSNTTTLQPHYAVQAGPRVYVWADYVLRFRQSDSGGATSFVSNSYDVAADYGRTQFLTRSRFITGASLNLPYGLSGTVYLSAHSSTHFNVTTGEDNNGDSIFNDRPAFATDLSRPSVVRTAIGIFDTNPIPGQTIIPVNYGVSPAFVSVQARLQRDFPFGRRVKDTPLPKSAWDGPVDRFFHCFVGVEAQNLFNRVNGSTPVGQLSSPYFGQSLTLNPEQSGTTAANRVVNAFAVIRF